MYYKFRKKTQHSDLHVYDCCEGQGNFSRKIVFINGVMGKKLLFLVPLNILVTVLLG